MFRKRHFSIHQQVVRKKIQPPRRRNRRIEHAHGSRRRVTRIHKNLAANPLLLPVQSIERHLRHHHFATHFEIRRELHLFQHRGFHTQRNRADRLHVRRHVLARRSVAARDAARQHSIFELQRDAQPVEFVFRDVFNLFLPASLAHASVPLPQGIVGKCVVQAQHRPRVPHRGKSLARRAAHGGKGRRRTLDTARHIFASRGIESELAETTGPGHATEIAQRAASEGRGLVIACGGDGTLNEVVNGLAANQNGHRVPLALLPGGTANILAKELDLPWDIPSAAEKLVRGTVKEIALGLATPLEHPGKKKYFLSVGGAGPDGMIVYSLDLDLKARIGMLAYWWEGAREVFRYNFQHFRVRIGDQKLDASLAIVGRTKNYGGPFKITTNADLFEDQFEVMALTTQSGFRYLSYLPTLWMGNLRGTEGVNFYKSDTVLCDPLDKNPVYPQVDGDPLARLPVEFKIVARALKLLVPASSS